MTKKTINTLLILSVIIICILNSLFSEKLEFEDGLGWDGGIYADISQEFEQIINDRLLDKYYIQRIVPSVIVHYSLKFLNLIINFFDPSLVIIPTDKVIIASFLILNSICIIIASYLWAKILDLFQVDIKRKLFAFMSLFLNYAFLKFAFYYPVLTDTFAFMVGVLMLYYYLTRNNVGLIVCAIVGFFSFPFLFYCALLLFIFPITLKIESVPSKNSKFFRLMDSLVPIASIFIFVILIYYISIYKNILPPNKSNPINKKLLFISLPLACFYLYKIFQSFWDTKRFFDVAKKINLYKVLLIFFLFLLFKFTAQYYSNPIEPYSIATFITLIPMQSVTNPLSFLVSHLFYYGISLSLIIFYWHDFKQKVKELGTGFELIVIAYLFLAIGSESRQFINALPFFVLPIILVMSKYNFKARFYYILLILNLFFSKVWYPINQEEFKGVNYLDFPWQNYFMSQGPWMSNKVYYVKAVLVLIGMFIIYRSIKKYKNRLPS